MLNFVKDLCVILCAVLIGVRELNEYQWQKEDDKPTEATTHLAVRNEIGKSEFGLHLGHK